jgi:hypothetical protein
MREETKGKIKYLLFYFTVFSNFNKLSTNFCPHLIVNSNYLLEAQMHYYLKLNLKYFCNKKRRNYFLHYLLA